MVKINTFETTGKKKSVYVSPACKCIEMEMSSSILQASAQHFEDGGRYGRSVQNMDDMLW